MAGSVRRGRRVGRGLLGRGAARRSSWRSTTSGSRARPAIWLRTRFGRRRARGRRAAALQRRLESPAGDPAAAEHQAGAPARAADRGPRRARDPRPDAPQVRGPRPDVGLDRLGQLDDRLVDATGERGPRARLGAARGRLRRELRGALGAGATWSAPAGWTRTRRARRRRDRAPVVHARARRGAVTADREGDRVRAAAGADRLAGDHLGARARTLAELASGAGWTWPG